MKGPSLRDRLTWMRPSVKRQAFIDGIYAQGELKWYAQDLWRRVRPPWKSSFWTGVYPIVARLEKQGILESGWEELPPGGRWARHPRRWYRLARRS